MQVDTITVTAVEARTRLRAYQELTSRQRTSEDKILESAYAMLRKGAKVLDVPAAIRKAGLNADGRPRMAIARSDWDRVTCRVRGGTWLHFTDEDRWGLYSRDVIVNPMPGLRGQSWSVHSPVPHIPAEIRPKFALSNFYTLFEVEKWETYPVDPILLRRIPKTGLFIVVAEWELTPLEASLLSGAL